MNSWEPGHLATVDAALDAARQGRPTVLAVEGLPGSGKTTLLREVLARAGDFVIASAEATESDREPYITVSRLGVHPPSQATPFAAAQSLREFIDERGGRKPVLVGIDDLQWADAESVQSVVWLLERAAGDPLLILVGSRPLHSRLHPEWQNHLTEGSAFRIELAGLSLSSASEVAQHLNPGASSEAVRRVWEMTRGNPLYFGSLLTEHSASELSTMRLLPAPTAFARDLTLRLERMGRDETALMRAAAAIGGSWQPLTLIAGVAGVTGATESMGRLVEAGLLEQSVMDYTPMVRPAHALIRAAVYQLIPLGDRRSLHLRAAERSTTAVEVLAHRLAAAEGFDEGLAADLEASAHEQHLRGAFRLAADQLRSASQLTEDPDVRVSRALEGLIEAALGFDFAPGLDGLAALQHVADDRLQLLRALLAALQNQWREAVAALESITSRDLEETDPLVRFRAEVLSAWAGVGGGASTEEIARHVDAGNRLRQLDPAFIGFLEISQGTVSGRLAGVQGYLDFTEAVPEDPSHTPAEATFRLAFRGMTRLGRGFHEQAVADLTEVERRMHLGAMDVGDGLIHAYLGAALWMGGRWQLAETKFRLAEDLRQHQGNPMTMALISLGHTNRGDLVAADAVLSQVRDQLVAQPWHEGIEFYIAALATRLHAGLDANAQRSAWDQLRDSFGPWVLRAPEPHVSFWLLHRTLLAVWAEQLDVADEMIRSLERIVAAPRWNDAAAHWLRGLVAERRGSDARARREFDDALARGIADVPLLHAHVLADRARVARDARSADEARTAYLRLGQGRYAEQVLAPSTEAGPDTSSHGYLERLSDRERDVVTLIGAGMSYAQIAQHLYISKSTVSFHLTNIYAKTGASNRHALTALVHAES